MRVYAALMVAALCGMGSLAAATQTLAFVFGAAPALGRPILRNDGFALYPPWAGLVWSARWREAFPRAFALGDLVLAAGLCLGALASLSLVSGAIPRLRRHGPSGWAGFDDVKAMGLFAAKGAVLGRFEGEMLAYDGPGHLLLIGASRSGKGRGHVVPTLLAWPGSALVLDVKGELADGDPRLDFHGTAGFRASLGPVMRFAPTRAASARFNPLFEVRKGANEVRDVQNVIEVIVDPAGEGRHSDFWDRSAKQVLVGVILHVLYTEPEPRKTLAVVREKLSDLDAEAQLMRLVLHRRNPATGEPEVHPEVRHAADSYLSAEVRVRSGIKATAESFFGVFADPLVAANTSASDFRVGDLMCWKRPVTLYLQPPPSDGQRLMPLMRLLLNQITRALMEEQARDAVGRIKTHQLLLVLDEFPQLGRMPFFETAMGAFAGYGLKAYLVCQSLNHIARAYGRDSVIIDNCAVVTAFAAADMETAKTIAAMAGDRWDTTEQESVSRPRPLFGARRGATTFREERRPLILPSEVRSLPREDELVFVAGAKPIRAQKLAFDREAIFTNRLLPSPATNARLTAAHDWEGVRPLGLIIKDKSGTARVAPYPGDDARTAAELFSSLTISERARAGLFTDEPKEGPRPTGI